MRRVFPTILWVTIFAVAMAFLETAVVIYLRKLYYPEGFSFPMKLIDSDIALTEFLREIATLIMLAGIGIIAGRKNIEKFALFIYSFAIWDIFYYVFLYALLGWPQNLLIWDVLFLVPVTWVGPVLAPVINSVTMIFLAAITVFYTEKFQSCRYGYLVWILLIAGSLVVIGSYVEDYMDYILKRFSPVQMFSSSFSKEVILYACTYIPDKFNWWIFSAGEAMHITAIIILWKQNRKPV